MSDPERPQIPDEQQKKIELQFFVENTWTLLVGLIEKLPVLKRNSMKLKINGLFNGEGAIKGLFRSPEQILKAAATAEAEQFNKNHQHILKALGKSSFGQTEGKWSVMERKLSEVMEVLTIQPSQAFWRTFDAVRYSTLPYHVTGSNSITVRSLSLQDAQQANSELQQIAAQYGIKLQ